MYGEPTFWQYEKQQEDGKIKIAPMNDPNGEITGHCVFGLKQWFDENPEERIRLGWVKHIMHTVEKYVEYNKQTQYVMRSHKVIDEYTYEDEYRVFDKTEAMMRRQEETSTGMVWTGDDVFVWEGA